MTLISVEHLSKSYQSHSLMGAGKPRCILDDISLTLNEGRPLPCSDAAAAEKARWHVRSAGWNIRKKGMFLPRNAGAQTG